MQQALFKERYAQARAYVQEVQAGARELERILLHLPPRPIPLTIRIKIRQPSTPMYTVISEGRRHIDFRRGGAHEAKIMELVRRVQNKRRVGKGR